ncbi:unnamed protein product [Caenorhabditis sp. 36 PRJEB53466]|nr:unnamed protein product [Caenorhabditis sp. 36 PRJEB53466]
MCMKACLNCPPRNLTSLSGAVILQLSAVSTKCFFLRTIDNYERLHPRDRRRNGIVLKFSKVTTTVTAFITFNEGCPFDGGTFEFVFDFQRDYDLIGPKITLRTKMWHPSVDQTDGFVYFNGNYWADNWSIYEFAPRLKSWMCTLDYSRLVEMEIVDQAINHPELFEKTARFWTTKYAGGSEPLDEQYEKSVQYLMAAGFSEEKATRELSLNQWVLKKSVSTELMTAGLKLGLSPSSSIHKLP